MGQWGQMTSLVEALVLTRNVGRFVTLFTLPRFKTLYEFLNGLGDSWTNIALYLGFGQDELDSLATTEEDDALRRFVGIWNMPDCGEKNLIILHKLNNVSKTRQYSHAARKGKDRGTLYAVTRMV